MKINSVEEIIEEIIILRYKKGYSTMSVLKHLKKRYDLGQARSYELIRAARQEIGKLYQKIDEDILEDSIAIMEEMKQRAIQSGNTKLELDVQKEINRIKLAVSKLDVIDGDDRITIIINRENDNE